MAGSFNKVLLMGNITRDIELKFTAGNRPVAQVGLAVNHKWKTPEGEAREEVMFVDCEAWGKTAEIIKQYFGKGRPIFIEGRLKLDTWQDKESGQNRSKHRVVIENFQFVDSKPGGGGEGGSGGEGGGYRSVSGDRGSSNAPRSTGQSSAPAANQGHQPIDESDIPF